MRALLYIAASLTTSSCACLLHAPLAPVRAAVAARRAPAALACDYEDDGTADEMEEALKRYSSMGLVDGLDMDDDDDDDDVTAEMMQVRTWSDFFCISCAWCDAASYSPLLAGVVQGACGGCEDGRTT